MPAGKRSILMACPGRVIGKQEWLWKTGWRRWTPRHGVLSSLGGGCAQRASVHAEVARDSTFALRSEVESTSDRPEYQHRPEHGLRLLGALRRCGIELAITCGVIGGGLGSSPVSLRTKVSASGWQGEAAGL